MELFEFVDEFVLFVFALEVGREKRSRQRRDLRLVRKELIGCGERRGSENGSFRDLLFETC